MAETIFVSMVRIISLFKTVYIILYLVKTLRVRVCFKKSSKLHKFSAHESFSLWTIDIETCISIQINVTIL